MPSKARVAVSRETSHSVPIPVEGSSPSSIEAPMVRGNTAKLRIFIVFYSMYGHVEGLARRMKVGVDGVDGVEGVLFRVPETVPLEVLEQMKSVPRKEHDNITVITPEMLAEADGFLFGFPTRYGCMAAQMKAFFDSTGFLWREQTLAGKPAGFFVSTGTQGGGQETTALVFPFLFRSTRYLPTFFILQTNILLIIKHVCVKTWGYYLIFFSLSLILSLKSSTLFIFIQTLNCRNNMDQYFSSR